MKNLLLAFLTISSSLVLTGCEKEVSNPNQVKYYTVSFDPSPGRFYLEKNGEQVAANGVELAVSVKVNYDEVSASGATVGNYTTTLNDVISTDSAGRMSLHIHDADQLQVSQEKFSLSTTQYKKNGEKVQIGRINSLDITISTVKNGVSYTKNIVINASAYFWDYVEGFYPLFGSDLPEFESRSSRTMETMDDDLMKHWYLKLNSNIVLKEI